jgi:peptidoglycan/LPS O-acetylase OafA/YrhL
VNVRAERFPLMDSLRAIAALLVLGSHAAVFANVLGSPSSPLRPYVAHLGTAGVSVFFLISGFLLYRPFVRARFAGEPAPRTAAYGWRRFLRIVPAYWVALTGVAIWLSLHEVFHPAWHIPVFYGFGQIYDAGTSPGGISQAWTLCVEITFYAFLPLWAWAMRNRAMRGEVAGLAALWLAGLAWKVFATRRADPSAFGTGPWFQPLPNFLDQFAVGMGLAVLSLRGLPAGLERAVRRGWPWWLGAAMAYWLIAKKIGFGWHYGGRVFLLRHELATLFALCMLVPAVFGTERRDAVRRLLGWRPLLYAGLVSYGIYLWHFAVVAKAAKAIQHWDISGELRFAVLCAMGLVGATAIATVSYYAVERPALSLKRLVGPPPERAQPGESLAEPAPATTTAPS